MRIFAISAFSVSFLLISSPASSDEIPSRYDRLSKAVSRIVEVQFSDGEDGAVPMLKACYEQNSVPNAGLTTALEECLAQDIAYSNLSTGFYRQMAAKANRSPVGWQPEYTTGEAMKTRVFRAMSLAGFTEPRLTSELKQIAAIALKALVPAVEAGPRK